MNKQDEELIFSFGSRKHIHALP